MTYSDKPNYTKCFEASLTYSMVDEPSQEVLVKACYHHMLIRFRGTTEAKSYINTITLEFQQMVKLRRHHKTLLIRMKSDNQYRLKFNQKTDALELINLLLRGQFVEPMVKFKLCLFQHRYFVPNIPVNIYGTPDR